MSLKLSKKEFALLDQVTNSLWSFLMMRILYSESDARQIALLGMTLIFAYSCSGFLRSKFVHPLYGGFGIEYQFEKFDALPILKGHLLRYFSVFISVFVIFLGLNSRGSIRFLFELVILMSSIVLLDFLRSFLQLNCDFFFAVFANILGIVVFLSFIKLESKNFFHLDTLDTIDFWIISNLVVSLLILVSLKILTTVSTSLISPTNDLASNFAKISSLSIIEFVQGRFFNLVGSAVLLQISEQIAANLVLALFIYSTLPFSVINGLSPYYLRNRKVADGNLSLAKYFGYICIATIIMPMITVISPSALDTIFGSAQQTQPGLIFVVILMVMQKSHESARSLDSMIRISAVRYSSAKIFIAMSVYLVAPISLGFGNTSLGLLILIVVLIAQIIFLRKSEK